MPGRASRKQRVGLYDYLTVLRWRWRFFALFVAIVVGAVGLLAVLMTPKYSTKATVYFVTQLDKGDQEDLSQVVLYPETVVGSYAEAATEPLVLDAVIQQLGLRTNARTLAGSVEADSPLGTVIIEIKATDPSARQAAAIANAVATQLVEVSNSGGGSTASLADASIRVSTIAKAGVPRSPSQPRKLLMVVIALFWGVLIGAVLCIWLARIDPRIRSRNDVLRYTSAPLLGFLPRESGGWGGLPLGRPRHDSSSRAQWGQLRANFAVLREGGAVTSVLFVSAAAAQTPARVVAHLGRALLATGTRVLLIDADLRPTPDNFGLGLSSVLLGECGLREAVIQLPDQPATLYPGPGLADPAGALASAEMAALLRSAALEYDVVLIRTAPLLAATEALALSRSVDGVVLVGDGDAMQRDLFSRALSALDRAGGRLRGVVLCA